VTAVSLGTALVPELNEPQEFAGAQLQVTPADVESLVTVAVRLVVAPGDRDAAGASLIATLIGAVEPPPPELFELPPQATKAAIILRVIRRGVVRPPASDLKNSVLRLDFMLIPDIPIMRRERNRRSYLL
jgi:hypothetical protein